MNDLTCEVGFDENVSGVEILLLNDFLAATHGQDFFSGNQYLEQMITQVGVLDLCVENFLYLSFFSGNGTENVPLLVCFSHCLKIH